MLHKDTAAINFFSLENNIDVNLIESVIKINNLIRKSYNSLDERKKNKMFTMKTNSFINLLPGWWNW